MKMKAALLIFLAILTVSGCVTTGNKKLDDVGSFLALREHVSTKIDVYRTFGQPHDVRSGISDEKVWIYYTIHIRPSAWTYIPIVGLAAGGGARTMTFAYFLFDSNGVLLKTEVKSQKDYENMWAGMGRGISNLQDKSPRDRVIAEMDAIEKPFDEKLAKSVSGIRDK